jgi:MtfA peptidase
VILLKNRRRKKLRTRPLPDAWRAILEARFPLYSRLCPADRAELDGHIQVFLAEKYFEGCGGLVITDEVRLLIAAQACILLLRRKTEYFPLMRTVLVYPGAFVGRAKSVGPAGMVTESQGWRLGESWHTPGSTGPVVLSWRDIQSGAADPEDGHNVVFHEFAHQLDAESGSVEGAPALESGAGDWARTMTREFHLFLSDLYAGRPVALNPYGAQSPAEFFAVATETFFERPAALRERHPGVYNQLARYFNQDPAAAARCAATLHEAVA